MYHQVNHGKLGVTLNLKQPRARSLLKQLVKVSDALIENMSPGSLERSELGYNVFKALNPKLVMLAMSAAGQFGELSGMRAYAPTMSSFVGLEALIGYQGEPPFGALNFALSDPSAAVHGLVPLLAALRRAQQTGEGCYIDLSQTEALLGTLRPQLIESQLSGEQPVPRGNGHEAMCPHGIYPAAEDGAWLTIAVGDDEQWSRLAAISGVETLANNTAYQSGEGRRQHREQLDSALATWTMTQPRDQLVAALRAAGIASSPVLSLDAAWRDAQFVSRGLKSSIEIPYYGSDEVFQAPWRFSGLRPKVVASGPTLGQHNKRVFGELLGLSGREIEDLEREGIIA